MESRHKLPVKKVLVFKIEYTFFNHRNEKYVEEEYQFLSPFKNWIQTNTSMQKFQCLKLNALISIKGRKYM